MKAEYITPDDATSQEAALSDPVGFVRGLDRITIDEVQRTPDVLQAIKVSVDKDQRQAWARDYLKTLLRRDLGGIAEVGKQEGMDRLFRILAHHSSQQVDFSQMGGQVGLDDKTTRRYVLTLEKLFLVRSLEP